jgi:hypothetical protein
MRRGPSEIFTAALSRETQAGRAAARLMFWTETVKSSAWRADKG